MAAAGDGTVSISSLKTRMQEVAEELEKYRQLYEASEKELNEEKAKTRTMESEGRELNQKLTAMESEYDQQASNLTKLSEKLEETIKVAEECDKQRKLLQNRRSADEEKLLELEQEFRETSEIALESEKRYDDASRKLTTAETELESDLACAEASELKVKNLQEDLKTLSIKLKSMKIKVEKAGAKETNYDKIIEDLRSQLKNAEGHGSQADKTTSMLQRELDKLQDELLQFKMLCQNLSGN